MQNYNTKFSFKRLILSYLILFVFGCISFFILAAIEENGTGKEFIFYLAKFFMRLICYPAFIFSVTDSGTYIMCGFLGIIIDGLFIELSIITYRNYKIRKLAKSL